MKSLTLALGIAVAAGGCNFNVGGDNNFNTVGPTCRRAATTAVTRPTSAVASAT